MLTWGLATSSCLLRCAPHFLPAPPYPLPTALPFATPPSSLTPCDIPAFCPRHSSFFLSSRVPLPFHQGRDGEAEAPLLHSSLTSSSPPSPPSSPPPRQSVRCAIGVEYRDTEGAIVERESHSRGVWTLLSNQSDRWTVGTGYHGNWVR